MHFVEEHCFGCVSALSVCADDDGYPTARKTFTNRLKRYSLTTLDGKDLKLTS